MVYLLQKQNRQFITIGVFIFITLSLYINPLSSKGNIIFYDPDVDISMGMFDYIGDINDSIPGVYPGMYIGGYFSLKSPFFSNYFSTTRIYNIFETGLTLNEIKNEQEEREYILTIPLHIDFAYRLKLSKRFSLAPFLGTGVHFTYYENFDGPFRVSPVIQTGLELKYSIWKNTSLKMKLDYGYVLDSRMEKGYIQYLKLRLPFPFIP